MASEAQKQQIIQQYQVLMEREKDLLARVADMQAQESEYRLVSETIRPLDAGRKCFHLINGVLVERTVGDVLPVVDQNRESLSALVKNLTEALQKAAAERVEYQRKTGIQAVPQSMAKTLMASSAAQQQAGGQGAGGDGGDDGAGGRAPARQGILA